MDGKEHAICLSEALPKKADEIEQALQKDESEDAENEHEYEVDFDEDEMEDDFDLAHS